MVAHERQRDPDGEHRADSGAGAGEFHGLSSFPHWLAEYSSSLCRGDPFFPFAESF